MLFVRVYAPGDVVQEDDVIAQIETDKVTIDVKFTGKSGKITALAVGEGDTVVVGQKVADFEEGDFGDGGGGGSSSSAAASEPEPAAAAAPPPPPKQQPAAAPPKPPTPPPTPKQQAPPAPKVSRLTTHMVLTPWSACSFSQAVAHALTGHRWVLCSSTALLP